MVFKVLLNNYLRLHTLLFHRTVFRHVKITSDHDEKIKYVIGGYLPTGVSEMANGPGGLG